MRLTEVSFVCENYIIPLQFWHKSFTKNTQVMHTPLSGAILDKLNDALNTKLHSGFLVLFRSKIIVPIEASHLGPDFQRIAKKSNAVSDS